MDHSFFFRFFPSFLSQSQKSGILLASGLIILGFSDALLPFVSDDVGLGQFHFIRSALSLFGVFWLARQTSMSIMPKSWTAVVMRSLFIIIAMMLFFGVLSFLPSAIAGAGLFTSPIFVLVILMLGYGVRPGWRRIVAVGAGSVGVWLLLRPDLSGFTIFHMLPVIAGLFYAGNIIATNRYCVAESPMCLLFFYFAGIGVLGLAAAVFFTLFPVAYAAESAFMFGGLTSVSLASYGWILIMSILTILSVWMLTVAYQTADASDIIVYEYSYLISAGISGWLLWNYVLGFADLLGILLIIGAGIIITRLTALSD